MPAHPATPSAYTQLVARAAMPLFTAHALLIGFATIAFVTIVLAPTPPWFLSSPYAADVYAVANRYSGPLYVTLGAMAALAHASGAVGAGRAVALFGAAVSISLGAEIVGTATGWPFGEYAYTPMLGYKIGDRVPFPIPLSWFYMLYGCLAIGGRLLPARDDFRSRLSWAAVAGLLLTAWDVSLDPAMSFATTHWYWIEQGPFYGMPWINFTGWWLTGTVVSFAMSLVVPPTLFARRISPSSLPVLLYAVNGVMPLAMVARAGLWWSFWPGLIAMAVPVILAGRAGRLAIYRDTAEGIAPRTAGA